MLQSDQIHISKQVDNIQVIEHSSVGNERENNCKPFSPSMSQDDEEHSETNTQNDIYDRPWNFFISDEDYIEMRDEFQQNLEQQSKISWQIRKMLSENMITKYIFPCLKVEDLVNIPFQEMSPAQKNFRIRYLWTKARCINQFFRLKHSIRAINRNQ